MPDRPTAPGSPHRIQGQAQIRLATWFTGYLRSATSAETAAQLMSTGATAALRVRGRWQLCRSSFRYLAVSARETRIWEAPRVLRRSDLTGLLRSDCGRKRRSLTSTPMSPVVSVEYINASSRQERTHDQERLILHRLGTQVSCDVHRRLSTARSRRDLGIRQWFMASSWPVCPRKAAQRRGSWSAPARSACTGLGRPGRSPAAAENEVKSVHLGCRTAMKRTLGQSMCRTVAGQLESTRGR